MPDHPGATSSDAQDRRIRQGVGHSARGEHVHARLHRIYAGGDAKDQGLAAPDAAPAVLSAHPTQILGPHAFPARANLHHHAVPLRHVPEWHLAGC